MKTTRLDIQAVAEQSGVHGPEAENLWQWEQRTKPEPRPIEAAVLGIVAHNFPAKPLEQQRQTDDAGNTDLDDEESGDDLGDWREDLWLYRTRTHSLLRRYLRYSLQTGRLPSILGGDLFRAKVSEYAVTTFEDRVIFLHDMEKCLGKLDKLSQELIARVVLQEHSLWSAARMMHCNEKTVRRLLPEAIDRLSRMLIDSGLLERVDGG